ncbi:MAG TPA: hypothetical protein VLM42_19410 [Bryobacteraceae bacterium]|nr:hypothetical protein [Bryobacteraceae bacterium]
MSGGKRTGAGRKAVQIDLIELEKLCSIHCTDEDLAAVFGVSVRTIEKRKKNPEFAAAMNRGKAKGRLSIRRQQFKLLEKGNPLIAKWLGKVVLGQRDVTPIELSGPNGNQLKISMEMVNDILDDEN